ncbi:hypothetical protein [Sedimentitalea todarodis]|uniref:GNAT family N-acetyltransferase n=1 Tax=Sedimentitalea todarodis TaxID=1631240 RepID=A0ABU3VKL0_9RHOB|nr:hypothetical protein [Sedimentitalea todarodis]MDU9006520.1 hypothetical protein [Sedimentitalea todarodis]
MPLRHAEIAETDLAEEILRCCDRFEFAATWRADPEVAALVDS